MSWAATAFRVCAWRYAWLRCLWAAVGPAGPGCGACGRRRGLAGILPATRACRCGGHPEQQWAPSGRREACGAWMRCLWAAAGPGGDTPGDESVPVWRAPGTAVGAQWAARGLRGLAGLRDDAPSGARGADGERAGRPRAARKHGGEAAAWKCGGEAAERKRGRQEFSVRRRRSRRGLLRNRSRMGRCGPSGSRGRSRRLRRLHRCRGPGRGRRRRRPGRV